MPDVRLPWWTGCTYDDSMQSRLDEGGDYEGVSFLRSAHLPKEVKDVPRTTFSTGRN